MREERRTIQTEVSVFIAEDGEEFEREEDCESYEYKLREKRLKLYDQHFEKVDTVNECSYAKLTNPEEINTFIAVCKYEGIRYTGVESPGVYMYVEGTYGRKNAWVNISNIIKSIEEKEVNE